VRDIRSVDQARTFYASIPAGPAYGYLLEDLIRAVYVTPEVLPAEGWAIDGGANRGMHTFELAAVARKVICYEPHHVVIKRLASEVLRRRLDNVILIEQALSDRVGTADFYIINSKPGGFALDVYPGLENEETTVVTVLLTTLDESLRLPRLDFVKLDLEGHDFVALRGGVGQLRQHRPVVAFEFGEREATAKRMGFTKDQFFAVWDELDYDLYDICGVPFGPDFWSARWTPWVLLAMPHERDPEPVRQAIDAALASARARAARGKSPAVFGPPAVSRITRGRWAAGRWLRRTADRIR
jgi:FkbM family methyltransferase